MMIPQQLGTLAVVYTGVLAGMTVAAVYVGTYSGWLLLGLTAAGVLLTVLSVGSVGRLTPSGADSVEDGSWGLQGDEMGTGSAVTSTGNARIRVLLFGVGLLVWSLIVLFGLPETLQ